MHTSHYCVTLEGGTDWLCPKVGQKVLFYAAWNPTRTQISFILRRTLEVT